MQAPTPDSIPSQHVSESENPEEDDEDVRLMVHNQRFQAAILKSMEVQIGSMEDQMGSYQHELKMSENAREDMALSFLNVKNELRRMRVVFDKNTNELEKTAHKNKTLLTERDVLTRQNETLEKEKSLLATTQSRTAEELRLKTLETINSKELLQASVNDLKVSRQIAENYTRENDNLLIQIKNGEKRFKLENDKLRKKCIEVKELEQELDIQESETKKAQNALERVVRELDLKVAAYDVLAEQQKATVMAMDRGQSHSHIYTHSHTHPSIHISTHLLNNNNKIFVLVIIFYHKYLIFR